MPSPFPGMDPYLEDPGRWPDVYARFINIASDLLAEQVAPKYFVRIEDRVYISDDRDPGRSAMIPDIRVVSRRGWEDADLPPRSGTGVEVAVPIVVTTMIEEEIHEHSLEIVDRERKVVVTVIELLSPSNKVSGSYGRSKFVRKRREVMTSTSHWVEIDLLRQGVVITSRELLPPGDYLVHVSRVETRPKGHLWPIRLSERLPVIPVPLAAGDPDARLDLQAVLTTAYDRARYDFSIDYTREPVPPLSPEWAAWSDRLLKEKGLRPA
jgi:Protein of unknown function (DUF4058)